MAHHPHHVLNRQSVVGWHACALVGLAMCVALVSGCGSMAGGAGGSLGYGFGRGIRVGADVYASRLCDRECGGGFYGTSPVRGSAGVTWYDDSGSGTIKEGTSPWGRRLNLTWMPSVNYFNLIHAGALLGIGIDDTKPVGIQTGVWSGFMHPFAGERTYYSGSFPGIGYSHWFNFMIGWRLVDSVHEVFFAPFYELARGGSWIGGS